MRKFSLILLIFSFTSVGIFGQLQNNTLEDDNWDLQTMLFSQGLIRTEQSAIALAEVIIEANYGKKFVELESLHAIREQQSLTDVWKIYGILTPNPRDPTSKEEERLLIVLEPHTGAIIGLVNFTKKQNPYTPYLLKSRKKGMLDNKNLAINYATTMLSHLDKDLTEGRSFKAKLSDGVWYITGKSGNKENKSITAVKIAQHNGEILAFELR